MGTVDSHFNTGGMPLNPPPLQPPLNTTPPTGPGTLSIEVDDTLQSKWQTGKFSYKFGGQGEDSKRDTRVRTYTPDEFNTIVPASERKKPTLALALTLLETEGITVDLDSKFNVNSGKPQIANIRAIPPQELEITDINGKKCFCATMTFEVTVYVSKEKDPLGEGGFRTIRFQQMIETSIEVPKAPVPGGKMSQEQVDHDAKVKAMGLLQAYGSTLSNPDLIGHNQKIQALAKKTFIDAQFTRQSTSKGFYERHNITWHNEPPKGFLARISHAFETHGSVSVVSLKNHGGISVSHLWERKIPCKHLDQKRDNVIRDILEVTKRAPPTTNPPIAIVVDPNDPFARVSTGYTDRTVQDRLQELKNNHGLSENDVFTMMRQDLETTQKSLNKELHGDSLDVHAVSLYKPKESIQHYFGEFEKNFKKIIELEEKITKTQQQIQNEEPSAGTDLQRTKLRLELQLLQEDQSVAVQRCKEARQNAEAVFNDLEQQHSRLEQEPQAIRSLCNQSSINMPAFEAQTQALDTLTKTGTDQNISGRMLMFREAYTMKRADLDSAWSQCGLPPFQQPQPPPQPNPV